jgi:two-component sensor histidine kinase
MFATIAHLTPTEKLFASLGIERNQLVPLARVLEQRLAFSEIYEASLRLASLDTLLEVAAAVAVKGCRGDAGKVMEHKPETGALLLRAGANLKPGFVGRVVGNSNRSDCPPGQCVTEGRAIAVPDVRVRTDYELPEIFHAHAVISSLNMPIPIEDGMFGVLEVDTRTLREFDALDFTFLASLAGLVGEAIERVRTQQRLARELDARGVLLREQQHRVRHHLQTVQTLLNREARESGHPDLVARFRSIERRVVALASLYDHLLGADETGDIDLAAYLRDLCHGLARFFEPEERGVALDCTSDSGVFRLGTDEATAVGVVITELVANALEHSFGTERGTIRVSLSRKEEQPAISVSDNGSAPSGAVAPGAGIDICRRLLQNFGATLLQDDSALGTRWLIRFPSGQ